LIIHGGAFWLAAYEQDEIDGRSLLLAAFILLTVGAGRAVVSSTRNSRAAALIPPTGDRPGLVKAAIWKNHNLRQRVPVISSQRPCGVWTTLIRMPSHCVHLKTAPMGAAYRRKDPTIPAESHAAHWICADVISRAKIS